MNMQQPQSTVTAVQTNVPVTYVTPGNPQVAPPPGYITSMNPPPPSGYVTTINPPPPHGYVTTINPPQPGGQQPTYVTQTTVTTQRQQSKIRMAIPELPMVLAVILCVINCILPGIGTIIAGFSVLCCGNVGQSGGDRFGTFCINFWVGICQILTLFFFVGWIWSIMWGVAFIAISAEANKKKEIVTTTTTTAIPGQVTTQPQPQPPPPQYQYSNPQPMPTTKEAMN